MTTKRTYIISDSGETIPGTISKFLVHSNYCGSIVSLNLCGHILAVARVPDDKSCSPVEVRFFATPTPIPMHLAPHGSLLIFVHPMKSAPKAISFYVDYTPAEAPDPLPTGVFCEVPFVPVDSAAFRILQFSSGIAGVNNVTRTTYECRVKTLGN